MRRRTQGQSLVEMALLLPLLLVVLFGIIDFSWYVYSYATVYMGSRNGAEEATMLPPAPERVGDRDPDSSDVCVSSIYKRIGSNSIFFDDLLAPGNIRITYPEATGRRLGNPIEVTIRYTVEPLTPLFRLVSLGNNGALSMVVSTRRTIESVGDTPDTNRSPNLAACN
ncbi:MAG: pilus assembly protein [Roseiflexaceae bacterium]|nr:pilus assembly protein [Roseiflexaceae bacterium]